jgi:hypothetical protein
MHSPGFISGDPRGNDSLLLNARCRFRLTACVLLPERFVMNLRPLAFAAGALGAATLTAWLLRRAGQPTPDAAMAVAELGFDEESEESPPSSYAFEADVEPDSLRISAQPAERIASSHLLDDNGALSPEELGAAFLAGATDTAVDEPPSSTADASGFQIFDQRVPEYQSDEAIDEAELAAILARHA